MAEPLMAEPGAALASPASRIPLVPAPTAVPSYDVVVPTVGRASLAPLLDSLVRSLPMSTRLIVVDDRPTPDGPLLSSAERAQRDPRVEVVASGGRGPAAARNAGWRRTTADWVAFLDDDVDVPVDWVRGLEDDLRRAGPDSGAVQGRLQVPLPAHRRPSDWERNVHGLEVGRWITADMAIRRTVLERIDGFDERFPRAYREDVDLALRALDDGWRLEVGRRRVRHPIRPAPWWVSVRQQAGNADDVLIERVHGPDWRQRLGVLPGTYPAHRTTVLAAGLALGAAVVGWRRLALAVAGLWASRTARFAWARIAPGPRTTGEVAAMALTSVAIPPVACYHRIRAHLRWARKA